MESNDQGYAGADRRRFPRVNACVEYRILDEESRQKTFASKNISSGGIAFFATEKLFAGTIVSLSINLPDTSGFQAKARVVWCENALFSWEPEIRYELGVDLIEIKESDRQKIAHYVFLRLDLP